MAVFTEEQKYIEIDDIYISSIHRKTGIGSILLQTVLETAEKNGIEKSYVYSATKDLDKVINFYKEHSYKTWCIQMFK